MEERLVSRKDRSNLVSPRSISGTELFVEFESLALAKELISSTISVVHLQSTLTILASERDFPLSIPSSSSSTAFRFPNSYRTTIVQIGSEMHRVLTETDSAMYRLQLAMKRVPDYIKSIFKLLAANPSSMTRKMLSTNFNSTIRTANEGVALINATIDRLMTLAKLVSDVRGVSKERIQILGASPSDKTDLVLSNGLTSKSVFEKIDWTLRELKQELTEVFEVLMDLEQAAKRNEAFDQDRIRLITNLYHIENTAYFLYQSASIYNRLSSRFVLEQIAGIGRYALLSNNEARTASISSLVQQWPSIQEKVQQVINQYQEEYVMNDRLLRQAYKKLLNDWRSRL